MAMLKQVRGIGDKGGIFWAGRPTAMLVLEDAFVLLQASTAASILGAQGLAGAAINAAKQHRDAKARDASGDDLTGETFSEQKRSRVIAYGEVTGARLERWRRARKLTIESPSGATELKYSKKDWPDEESIPCLTDLLGDRFTSSVDAPG
jgi:hypothetical protein